MSAASLRIVEHQTPAALYPEYMLAMHGISRAAVPLLETAAHRTESLSTEDPLVAPLLTYLRTHIPEEAGHADWVLEDLSVIGLNRARLLSRVPSVTVAALVGSQYYWIEHVHPVAIIGYLAIMEANPPSLDTVAHLIEATGFPAAAFRSMRVHARLDVQHREGLYRAMDELPLTPWHERLIATNALRTAELLTEALIELVDAFDSGRSHEAHAIAASR